MSWPSPSSRACKLSHDRGHPPPPPTPPPGGQRAAFLFSRSRHRGDQTHSGGTSPSVIAASLSEQAGSFLGSKLRPKAAAGPAPLVYFSLSRGHLIHSLSLAPSKYSCPGDRFRREQRACTDRDSHKALFSSQGAALPSVWQSPPPLQPWAPRPCLEVTEPLTVRAGTKAPHTAALPGPAGVTWPWRGYRCGEGPILGAGSLHVDPGC